MYKITMFFLMPVLVAYAQYLKNEQIKAQRYVDGLNNARNYSIRDSYSGLRGFRRDWYAYEDEYMSNWDRG